MNSREKSRRNHPNNPSFSSTLLDEIYRSIDGNDDGKKKDDHYHHHHHRHHEEDLKVYRERSISSAKKHSVNGGKTGKASSITVVEDAEMASLKRACLIEKWMEKQVNDKVSTRRNLDYNLHDDDTLFFSTTSSSSDSSSGALSSSSDTEFFASVKSSKSCFTTIKKPKPVKTTVSPRSKPQKNEAKKQSKTEEDSKSRALKIYANLKKMKEPISPGGKLTAFINNLFTSGNSKKNPERKSSNISSTCSSASSFSRSCLSKTSPTSKAKFNNDGIRRTVRFYPVSVIVDEDSRPCGHKKIHDLLESDKFVRPPLSEPKKIVTVKPCHDQKKDSLRRDRLIQEDFEDDDEEDAASDCSSDLFEIDHLALFGNGRFREELPVYETTHLDTNRAIATGLIR